MYLDGLASLSRRKDDELVVVVYDRDTAHVTRVAKRRTRNQPSARKARIAFQALSPRASMTGRAHFSPETRTLDAVTTTTGQADQ